MTRGPHHAAPSFARAADAYERARPGYAPAAVTFLVERLGLCPGRVALDLGAGTFAALGSGELRYVTYVQIERLRPD